MGNLRSEYTDPLFSVINGYSARLSGACLQHVLTDPDVEYVEVRTACSSLYTQGKLIKP